MGARAQGLTKSPSKLGTIMAQKKVLKKAAKEAAPFCEECDKKEESEKKEITQIYCIIDNGEERRLSKLPIGKEFTVCVETKGMDEGEKVTVDMKDAKGRTYKSGEKTIKLKGTVEMDGIAYIDGVKVEFK